MALPNPLLQLATLAGDLERVEEALRDSVRTEDAYLTELASHLIQAGGKRGRPAFALAAAATAGDRPDPATTEVVLGGVAVELVHLGSLYHDDVMDEATTRRTVESVNARWGNLQAILAGDFLLARASEIAAGLGTEIAALLARTIGRLCEGQILELQNTYNTDRSEASYLASIEGKTASLYATACRIGALTAGVDRSRVEALTRFGLAYGMAFQIIDDILDLTATDEQLGKPAGHDLIEGVYTLPVILALAERGGPDDTLGELLGRPLSEDEMQTARRLVRESGRVDDALRVAEHYVESALDHLRAVGTGPAASALAGATRHLLDGAADATRASTSR